MYQKNHYRIDHPQKPDHLNEKCHMKCINDFESSLMDQNLYLLQEFVRCKIQCDEKAKVLQDSMEFNDFNAYERFFSLVSIVHT